MRRQILDAHFRRVETVFSQNDTPRQKALNRMFGQKIDQRARRRQGRGPDQPVLVEAAAG
jgi:hypothetical protein